MMNLYAWIILSALFFEFALNLAADILNLKALSPDLPAELTGFYDAATYRRSQKYTRVTTKFGIVTSTLNLGATLIFWFCGGFDALDNLVRTWRLGPTGTGLAYIGILLLLLAIFNLPFNIYKTFIIEEHFGFNKTAPRTFILDMVKELGLAIIIGSPLLAIVLAFFQYAGDQAWLYCWIISTIFILFIQFIAPTWIMPLFNKFQPLEEGELKERIMAYARSANFPLGGIFIIDSSRRSTKSNAFFTGFGKNKRIVLYDTLIERHTIEELLSILAHEIGHYKKRHILTGIIISILHMGVIFFLLSVFLTHKGLYDAFSMRHISIYAGFIFFGMLYSPVELVLSFFTNMLSRRNEYQADRFAIETTRLPEAFINALKKLSVYNLSNLTPHPFYVFLHASHPPILKRILNVKRMLVSQEA